MDLQDKGFDMDLTGFNENEIEKVVNDLDFGDNESGDFSGVDESQTRMVQLFMTHNQHTEFVEMVEALAKKYGTDNITDTVWEAVNGSYQNIKA